MTDIDNLFDTERDLTAKIFRERRIELGYTQEQVAKLCGWQRTTVSRIEAGRFFINTKQLYSICSALKLKINFQKI